MSIHIEEESLPIKPDVQIACEMLGFDPLYLANEGKLLVFLPARHADKVLKTIRKHPLGRKAAIIGNVTGGEPSVRMKTLVGSTRIVEMITGEQLPRIC